MDRTARSRTGMVVAAHPLAAEAGREVLAEGGNAVEAAVAACLALGVVEPFASGLGGGGYMLVHQGNQTEILDFRGVTSSLASEDVVYPKGATLPWQPKVGPSSATIPGQGRALDLALRRYGRGLPLSRLTRRAIEAAENGFNVSEVFTYVSGLFEGTLRAFPDAARTYFINGHRRKPGDRLVQPDLARTLRRIAQEGFEALYTGEIGRAIVATINSSGPVWGEQDLERYEVKIRRPLLLAVAGAEIATTGPPSRGGAGIAQALLRWETNGLRSMAHHSSEAIIAMTETFRDVFSALEPVIGDPDVFSIDVGALGAPLAASDSTPKAGSASTTHLTVVDRNGMVVALSTTIGHFWGSGVIVPGWGILLNDDISDMERGPGKRNSVGSWRRSVSNMAPTLVFRAGRPWFTLGSPGSLRIFPALSQVIANVLFHGMDLEGAVAAGRVHWEDETLWLEGHIDLGARLKVRETWRGKVVERRAKDLFFGGVHAAAIEPDGTIVGVADPRRDGVAAGV
ncbi:MAG: gamma-glutamyltransferase family protein [Planctomycetes bacterium]|nr:gamma-glutamyltransferase family protein [Planctomycetota bacterium]